MFNPVDTHHILGGGWTRQELGGHGVPAAENWERVEGILRAHRAIY